MFKKWILLIQLGSVTLTSESALYRYKFPPLGLLYISSFLRLHGYDVKIMDLLSFGKNISYFLKKIKEMKKRYEKDPLLVGFSVYTENVDDALLAASYVKNVFKSSLIVFGGAHAKADYEGLLKSKVVDIVSLVEGEGHIIELVNYAEGRLEVDTIRGIAYLRGNNIKASMRFFINDLNVLPFPDFMNVKYKEYRDLGILVTSRGCPGKCIFCASRQFSGSKYRAYSAERIFAEMMFLYLKFKRQNFAFMDDTFTALKKRTKKFVEILKKYGSKDFLYAIKSRVDFITGEVLNLLEETNCDSIHIGVESADNRVLAVMKKRTMVEKNIQTIEKVLLHGIIPECSFILGNPGDNPFTMYKTLIMVYIINKKLFKYIKYSPALYALCTPYPGTELARNSESLRLKIKVKDWRRYDCIQPIFETEDFSIDFLRKTIWEYENHKDIFIKKIITSNKELKEFFEELSHRLESVLPEFEKKRNKFMKKNFLEKTNGFF